ncbi:hypothetical protein [Streptomyces heilongjiangensis]|uniref:Uncharacterized protein n=1 Tax=Streptomyces heilongjiangensis TaxID=945052 RepID=A0ABW1B799_9ACTN|nr:hypothetical protein [Streptomyces heilongjiangensis]MDC2951111.1 hypothetical protein [Streptomyces heilongjiangensis]
MHLWQRVDSRAHFTGALDEVLVVERASSDDDVAGSWAGDPAARRGAILWLPMDRVDRGH